MLTGSSPSPEETEEVVGGWSLSIYPEVLEAAGTYRVGGTRGGAVYVGPGDAVDPERTMRIAAGRAASKLKRYVVANRLNRLGTLTYAGEGCHDPVALRRDVGEFFRRLRAALGGDPFPYAWVPEWHPGGHGLHVHFTVGRFVPRTMIAGTWGRGFVHIKLLSDLPVGTSAFHEAYMAAGYLAKYVSKAFGEDRVLGLHRYEVAQGFQPKVVRVIALYLDDLIEEARKVIGARPTEVLHSDEWPMWSGPKAVVMRWSP